MKLTVFIVRGIASVVILSGIIGVYWFGSTGQDGLQRDDTILRASLAAHGTNKNELSMLTLIREQNETIARMSSLLHHATVATKSSSTSSSNGLTSLHEDHDKSADASVESKDNSIVKGGLLHTHALMMTKKEQEIERKDHEIALLKERISSLSSKSHQLISPQQQQPQQSPQPPAHYATYDHHAGGVSAPQGGQVGEECEAKYGYQLVTEWKKAKQVWCAPDSSSSSSSSESPSSLTCYPYHQQHKKLDGRGADMFCVAENMFVDFSKVEGGISHAVGMAKLGKYLKYKKGALFSPSCKKTSYYRPSLFMPHNAAQMSAFQDASESTSHSNVQVEDTPTYLLARDEDCENSFHSTADFTNMHLVSHVIDQDPASQQVILWDQHKDGPYTELISKTFAGGKKLLRPRDYQNKVVKFKKLIFHLESPAGLIFPKVARPGQLRCKSTWLFTSYAERVLRSFNLWNVAPPRVPHATMLIRNRTPTKNVGRIMSNQKEVEGVLREGNMMTHQVVDTAKLPFGEQLQIIRATNILIGVHGAGLMLILFAADEAVLLEVHPSYRQDRHFRHASRMVGHSYIPIRSMKRETCHGSSDNVEVPLEEFRAALDSAVRLARQFDTGISECGLKCPSEILALDRSLDPYYSKLGVRKTGSVNTKFPC
jgi:hypothetical protein